MRETPWRAAGRGVVREVVVWGTREILLYYLICIASTGLSVYPGGGGELALAQLTIINHFCEDSRQIHE